MVPQREPRSVMRMALCWLDCRLSTFARITAAECCLRNRVCLHCRWQRTSLRPLHLQGCKALSSAPMLSRHKDPVQLVQGTLSAQDLTTPATRPWCVTTRRGQETALLRDGTSWQEQPSPDLVAAVLRPVQNCAICDCKIVQVRSYKERSLPMHKFMPH
jgi:hypothetical protein